MNATAARDDWTPIVEQWERQGGDVDGLPSLEAEFGRGIWRVVPGSSTKNGLVLLALYWRVGNKKTGTHHTRVGSLYTATGSVMPRPRNHDKCGSLTVGFDDAGRKLVRVRVEQQSPAYNIMAVVWESCRGEMVPRPVPAFGVEVNP